MRRTVVGSSITVNENNTVGHSGHKKKNVAQNYKTISKSFLQFKFFGFNLNSFPFLRKFVVVLIMK